MSAVVVPSSLRHRPSVLEVGSDAIERSPQLLTEGALLGRAVALVCGPGPTSLHAERLAKVLSGVGVNVLSISAATGLELEATTLGAKLSGAPMDTLVIGVGGGSVLDVAKLAARIAELRLISVPTNLAHDGICSPVASLLGSDGRRGSVPAVMPAGVIIDLTVVGSAPRSSMVSGVGDLLSNFTAAMDWQLSALTGREKFKRSAAALADRAARPSLYGPTEDDDRFTSDLAHGLVLSGMAMGIAGSSRPCSGAEHLISHSLDLMLGQRSAQHGMQVALGTLFSAAAHGRYLPELQARFIEIGLPLHPRALGITTDEFVEAIRRAPATRPNRYTILDELPSSESYLHELTQQAFVQPGVQQAS